MKRNTVTGFFLAVILSAMVLSQSGCVDACDSFPVPIVADFTATPTDGIAPLTVRFTDTSRGDVTSREWDFDNDGIIDSTAVNPIHTYANPGVYTVSITVSAYCGSDTRTRPRCIIVTHTAGTTVHVDNAGGDDALDGASWATAVKTMKTGLDIAASNSTVLVADGEYRGERNRGLDFRGKVLHLMSAGGAANCIINCENEDRAV